MSIEEAEYILNEAVIEEPSVSSYTYISAEEINGAINKILEERLNDKIKIQELEKSIIKQKSKFEEIIKEKELKNSKYPFLIYKNKLIYLRKAVGYLKKVVKPLFLLENQIKLVYNPKVLKKMYQEELKWENLLVVM